ncbi:MAG TPA: FtsW/RodA/SpoVE family cell cycle protein [Salinivirgaceae bacterium]|nr:FtsW/RodA/SpoVE family cell cycle protein [Salinivirgaceae bacterium]
MKQGVFNYLRGDKSLWVIMLILMLISLLTVYSATGTLAYKKADGNTTYYLLRQVIFITLGFSAAYFVHTIPHRNFAGISVILYAISVPLLLYTLIRGASYNEAARWISLPGGFTFQSSDFAKLALMMFLATLLSNRQNEIKELKKGFLYMLIPVGITCGLILPANFSTAALLFMSAMLLLFSGRVQIKHIMYLGGVALVGLTIFIVIALNSSDSGRVGTWKRRIENFVSKGGDNFQSDQAKIAISTGGFFGKGPGQSVQRNILPHPYSDFIYAIIVEEYGLVMGIVIMALYLMILFRTVALIRKCKLVYSALLVTSMTILLVLQAFVHIAVNTGIFPVTGQTLPMISMGGTSMIFNGIQMGIILGVSRELKENPAEFAITNEEDESKSDEELKEKGNNNKNGNESKASSASVN